MNYSRQRELILSEVRRAPVHPTAETVFRNLRSEYPKLSLGTVYRNLNLLSEIGEIRKIPMPNAKDRFDGDLSEHYHMVCSVCGKVADVGAEEVRRTAERAAGQCGYELQAYDLILYGVCPECRQKRRNESWNSKEARPSGT